MGLCYLLSLLLFVRSGDRFSRSYGAALPLFAAALLFKEPAATLPVALVLFDALFLVGARGWRRTAARVAPFVGVLAGYLWLRRAVLGGVAPTAQGVGLAARDHVLAVLDLLARYLKTLVLPVDLNVWHVVGAPATIVSARGLGIVLAIAGLAAAGALAWRGRPLPAFALFLALVPLLPSFALGALNQGPSAAFAERYLYLPAFGFLLLLVTALRSLAACWPRTRRAIGAGALVLALAYALGSIRRIPVWRDSLSLWSDAARRSPASAVARANLGFALLYAGRAGEGEAELARARDLDPAVAREWVAKGIGYARHGLSGKAILALHTALALDPNLAEAHFNLGVLYDAQGSRENALAAYERAVALNPGDVAARNNLAVAYAESGRMDDARRQLQEAARLAPDDPEIRANLERTRADARPP